MPSEPSVGRFYVTLLASLGAPLRPRARIAELEQLTLRLLRTVGVRMLIIDELHHILAGGSGTRREFLNLLRFLVNELRIPLVGVGTREAYLAIRSDDQLENRFEPHTLPRWKADHDACALLASFAAAFPLRRRSPIATTEMAEYLLARSEGTIGELAHLLTDAAVAAIESGEEAITGHSLHLAPYTGPTERRRQFERELAWAPHRLVRPDGRCIRHQARSRRSRPGSIASPRDMDCPVGTCCGTISAPPPRRTRIGLKTRSIEIHPPCC